MILLKHKVLKNIVLRRTKIGRAADLALPPRIVSFIQCGGVRFQILKEGMLIFCIHFMQVSLRKDCLDIKEQDYYESLYNESQAQFNTYVTFFFLFSFPYNEIIVKHIVLRRKEAIGRYEFEELIRLFMKQS